MRLVFGDCEFDPGRRLVLRQGRAVPLSPRAFQLLALLLDRRPEALTKTELLDRLWPGTFVSDASLHNLMTEVRTALGDAPRAARYIRTIPRYGYAFHGDAQPLPRIAAATAATSETSPWLFSSSGDWRLSDGMNLVGRDRDCTVRIDSPTVSRHHARIVVSGYEATVEDLNSKNGTYVDGQRASQPLSLADGSEIRVGSVTMTYRKPDTLNSTVSQRPR